jgi:hypothetical protein
MAAKRIPDEVKAQVNEIVARFNEGSNDPTCYYVARFRGPYLYLDRSDFGQVGPICRLKYTGDMDSWEFAIHHKAWLRAVAGPPTDRWDSW